MTFWDKELTVEEALSRFDRSDKCAFAHIDIFEDHRTNGFIRFFNKDHSLVELIPAICTTGLSPVVDKASRLVIGAEEGAHRNLCTDLFRYYLEKNGGMKEYIDPSTCADYYIERGYGFAISSMATRKILAGIKYREDAFDKDLFLLFDVVRADDHFAMARAEALRAAAMLGRRGRW